MNEYHRNIKPIEMTRSRRKHFDSKCTEAERKSFLRLTGQLNFLGHATLPQASYVASIFQQFVGNLKICLLYTSDAADD